ncbi:10 TM acyl transferase domain found in Cas1p-domain-containing protein [Chlamydoabsidia padenii]|nr:10 TM acyl transferase domain found in Cas1p-domain-containing protein [Chlamydoabsidia padenii]
MGGTSVVHGKLLQLGICITFCIVIFTTLAKFILDANDRTRCEGMLNDGAWVEKQWQPSGCMMHSYQPDQVAGCLNHSHILYIGDATIRQQFNSLAQLINNDIETTNDDIDRKYEFIDQGLTFEFWWDPYINGTRTLQYLQYSGSVAVAAGIPRPSLLVIGGAADWRPGVDNLFDAVQRTSQVADAVIISPSSSLDMNDYLATRRATLDHARTPFAIPIVWNKLVNNNNNLTRAATDTQVQLALNYRCNDIRAKHFPYTTTCCFHYPKPRWYQNIFFGFFLVLVPAGFYLYDTGLSKMIPSEKVLHGLFVFGLCVIYMYFGDRTQLFGKMPKHFDNTTFTVLMVMLVGVAGLTTLKTQKKEGTDLGFLNRDQTDEWKGWMQVIILIYHFMGASGTSGIYNAVRILVAAYLFQTGYGHFFFFYKKADFGLARVLNVMVRLNFLTFVLQYLMDTDYLSYYFTPLVSFWFGVIYLTMYIGHQYNKKAQFMCAKIVVAALVTTALIQTPGIMEFCFDTLAFLFNIHWNANEWRFRLALDGFIVYVGMLSAFGYIKCLEHKWMDRSSFTKIKTGTLIGSGVALLWYFWFELTRDDKFAYNRAQPYISWIPILAFVFLRNATVRLRNTSSQFFIFIGKISLETFIGQFHMWLAGDTKGLLLVIPYPVWVANTALGWYTNLVISTFLFISASYYLGQTTGELTRWICHDLLMTKKDQRRDYVALPLLPTANNNNNNPEEDGVIKSQAGSDNGDEGNDEQGLPITKTPPLWYRIITDPMVKVALFLLGVGILNRLT